MTIDDKIRDEKPQNDINREAANLSAIICQQIYYLGKLINMNILKVKKYYLLIEEE